LVSISRSIIMAIVTLTWQDVYPTPITQTKNWPCSISQQLFIRADLTVIGNDTCEMELFALPLIDVPRRGRRSLMKPSSLARWLSMLGVAALLMVGAASAADVHVMISAGFYGVYSELGPAFERASGHRLITTRGPSMGDSPEAIPTRLGRGEAADVVILDGGAADELGRRGLVRADSKIELARSLIGMVVRAGAAKPDIGSVEALRSTLLATKSIAYSDSGSGTYLSTTLFPKLGVADQVAGKSRKVRGPPSGEPVAAVVARGEAEIGFQQVSELIHVPGITFVGTIPAEVQPMTFFAGALTSTVGQPEAASALIRFLASPEAAPVILKAGLMPLSGR
jgi:molybdate transport system substrate-binding protein